MGGKFNLTEEIDNQIVLVQKSTKTVLPFMAKPHNKLRQKFHWYYKWHLNPYHKIVHWSALSLHVAVIFSLVASSVFLGRLPASAATTTKTWTTYNDFTNNASTVNSATTQASVTVAGSGIPADVTAGTVTVSPGTASEDFSTTTNKDAGSTTATWDTTAQTVSSPSSWGDKTASAPTISAGSYMSFVDANNGYAIVASNKYVYKTTNGGVSWTQPSIVTLGSSTIAISSMHFISATTGFVAGTWNDPEYWDPAGCWDPDYNEWYGCNVSGPSGSVIFRTTNSGGSWTAVSQLSQGAGETVTGINFPSASIGYAVGQNNLILKTTDGGANWSAQTGSGNFTSVYCASTTTCWAVGTGNVILKTTNGGTNWSAQTSGTAQTLSSIACSGASNCIAAGASGTTVKTTDGGTNWSVSTIVNTPTLNSVVMISSTVAYIIGSNGFYKTDNTGSSWWSRIGPTPAAQSAVQLSSTAGVAATSAGIVRTTDGWTSVWQNKSMAAINFRSISFPTTSVGFAAGDGGVIYTTADGGATWTAQTSNTVNNLRSIYFSDASNGWAVGVSGTIMHTANGGTTWAAQTSNTANQLNAVYFTDSSNGWAVGISGTIDHTSDGGTTWATQTSNTPNGLNSVFFVDSNNGWAAGNSGTIDHTSDGGTTWATQTSGTASTLNSVSFTSTANGRAVGASGVVVSTTNGGAAWSASTLGSAELNSVGFANGYGIIGGASMALYSLSYTVSTQAQSTKMNSSETITVATMTATTTLNGQSVAYYLSADGGSNWESVTSGESHSFTNTGSDLRWRAVLTSDGANTPIITTIALSYGTIGTITNLKINAGGTAGWGTISWAGTTPGASTITFKTRSAATEGALTGSWGSAITTSGTAGSINTSGTADDEWLEIQMILTADGSNYPTLNDFSVTYTINATPVVTIDTQPAQGSNGVVSTTATVSDSDNDTATLALYYYNGSANISGGITAGSPANGGTLALSSATGLLASGTILVDSEIIAYASISSNTLQNITRAQSSTRAASHTDAANAYLPTTTTTNTGSKNTGASGNQYIITWTPGSDFASSYTAGAKVRILANDAEVAMNIGIGTSSAFALDTKNPVAGGTPVSINGGAAKTNSTAVTVTLSATDDTAVQYAISESQDALTSFSTYSAPVAFTLSAGDGVKTVYVKFQDTKNNLLSTVYSDTIELDTTSPIPQDFYVADSSNVDASRYMVTVSWTVLSNDDFSLYSLERSTNGTDYSELATFSNIATENYVDKNLSNGTTYYYKLRSQDVLSNWSSYSEVSSATPGGADSAAPTISGPGPVVTAADITAAVSWTTNEVADSFVEFGTTTGYGSIQGKADSVTSHSVTVVGLAAQTTYHFRVRSRDTNNNVVIGSDNSFTTTLPTEADDSPVITSPTATTPGTAPEEVTITWTTDKYASSQVLYGTTQSLGSTTTEDATLNKTHVVDITNLEPDTTYYYQVRSKDTYDNVTLSDVATFTTLDNSTPVISSVVANASINSAIITWTTSIASDSFVEFGKTASYGTIQGSSDSVTQHSVTIIGLDMLSSYHFRVKSTYNGNTASSSDGTFDTSLSADALTELVISNINAAVDSGTGKVSVTWTTNKAATSSVSYGITESLGSQSDKNTNSGFEHYVVLSGLSASTKYYYKVESEDSSGNTIASGLLTFATKESVDKSPAAISAVVVSDVTLDSALISWKTSIVAKSTIKIGETDAYGKEITDQSTGATTIHTVKLSDLKQGTAYHFRLTGESVDGTSTIASDDYVFSTLTLPQISEIVVKDIASRGVTITWKTNVLADSFVDFGPTSPTATLDKSQGRSEEVVDHAVALIGLESATKYQFKIKSRDKYTNLATSDTQTFTTIIDTTPPVIKDLKSETSIITDANGTSKAQAIVSWSTDEPATSQIQYSMGVASQGNYQLSTEENLTLSTSHIVVISNLMPSATYHMKVVAKDASSNIAASDDYTVLTLKQETTLIQYIVSILEERFFWIKGFGIGR
ncbi:MAG: YCF48-related protein [Patescibacteria group bacterium]